MFNEHQMLAFQDWVHAYILPLLVHLFKFNFHWLSMVLTCCHSLNAIIGFCLLVFYVFTNLGMDASNWIFVVVGGENTLLWYILDKKIYVLIHFLKKSFIILKTHKNEF
jgi:hypothetical protein